jgi:hypothetical protein
MGTTPIYALPYPEPVDPADVPLDLRELAERIEAIHKPLGYVERTTALSVTPAATQAAPLDVLTLPAITFDGGPVEFQFFTPAFNAPGGAGASISASLWETTDLGELGHLLNVAAAALWVPFIGYRRLTPSAGVHTYRVRAWLAGAGANGAVYAGAGGAGAMVPATLSVRKV